MTNQREIKFRFWNGTDIISWDRAEMTGLSPRDFKEGDTWKVMQLTGLKDEKGGEIYEGDILSFVFPVSPERKKEIVHYHEVYWNNDHGQWYLRGLRGVVMEQSLAGRGGGRAATHTIAGNIYHNPELLTEPAAKKPKKK